MEAIRISSAGALILSMNHSLLLNPDLAQALTEEADGEDDDA